MKRIISILLLLLLFIPISFGQNIEEDWDKLVDYVNGKYIITYINSERTNKKEEPNIIKFDKNIKPQLDNATINEPVKFDELSKLLIYNGWKSTESNLAKILNKKKDESNKTIDELLSLTNLTSKFQELLYEQRQQLDEELRQKYTKKNNLLASNPIDNAQQSDISNNIKKEKSLSGIRNLWFYIIIFIQFVLLVVFLLLWHQTRREKIINIILSSSQIEEKYLSDKNFPTANNPNCNDKISQLENEMKKLRQRMEKIEIKPVNHLHEESISIPKTEKADFPEKNIKEKYLKLKSGDEFHQVVDNNDENVNFKLSNIINDNEADFSFCGNIQNAIKDYSATFDGVCEYEGDPKSAKDILNVASGRIEKQNGKWKVIKKAKIKFE